MTKTMSENVKVASNVQNESQDKFGKELICNHFGADGTQNSRAR